MAEKLSITIGLEGGKELERQLADIGKAGQKAFLDIANAAQQAGGFKNLKPEEVTAKLKEMGVTGADALNKIQDAVAGATRVEQLVGIVQKVERGFAGLASAALTVVRNLGPIGAAAGLVGLKIVGVMTDAAAAINKADAEAIKLGISIEKFDQLRMGFEKMGISAKAIGSGIETMQKNLAALDVDRVKLALEAAAAGAGLGSAAMKELQAAAQGTGKAADDARAALSKLADVQALKSLKADVESTGQAAARAREALAKLAGVPEGTPGKAQEVRQLQAAVENTGQAAERASAALAGFKPQTGALTGASAAFERLGIAAGDVSNRMPEVVAALARLPDSAQRSADAILLLGQETGTQLVQAMRTGGVAVDQFVAKQQGLTQEQANAAALMEQSSNRMEAAWERFKTAIGAKLITNTDLQQLTGLLDGITALLTASPAQWAAAFDTLTAPIQNVISQIGELASAIGGGIWDTFASAGQAAINTLIGWIDALIGKIQALGSAIKGAFSGGGGGGTTPIPGNAAGGLIGGRGTGTSDSNLSWVSRGEHVMPARAVRQPGVLAFLEMLRRSGGNLSRVMDGMGRYATGGLVGMPALAAGGGLSGMSHVTIQFPGLDPISGLRASSNVVDELRKAAAMAQVRSGGRKPSRYT